MDFVQGESLARLVRAATSRREHIPPAMVVAIMVGVLHGLHAAHEAKNDRGEPLGVVHRDVSPAQRDRRRRRRPRVLDFGVAKAVGRLQTTQAGQLKGKLAYMAPEQLRGTVSRATDVYSASVVLWEALTGRRLFTGDNEAHMFGQVLAGCTDAPSKYMPAPLPLLDAVTMRGLRVDPAERFQTAREMACALEDVLPLATASRIGAWVEGAAKETLDQRSAMVAAIESDVSFHAPPVLEPSSPSIPGRSESRGRVVPLSAAGLPVAGPALQASTESWPGRVAEAWTPPTGPVGVGDELIATQLSSGSASTADGGPVRTTRLRRAWLVAGAGLLVLVGAVALRSAWSASPPPAAPQLVAAETAAARPPAASPVATAPDPTTPLPAPTAATTPTAAPTSPTSPLPAVGTGGQSAGVAAGSVGAAPRATAAQPSRGAMAIPVAGAGRVPAVAPNCDPPYIINDVGHRVRKPECH